MVDNLGSTALHCSAQSGSYEVVTYFAEILTDIHLQRNDRTNCLHIAAIEEHWNLCKELIDKHNFDLQVTDNRGWTAVHYSVENGSYELFKHLADMGTDIHLKTSDGKNCLHIAALKEHLNLCKVLMDKHKFDINMTDNDGFTALHYSAQIGSSEQITYFANMGANTHLKTNDGTNCLHIAALNGHLNLCKVFIDKHKFHFNTTDNHGWAALHYSAGSGNYELVTYLADMGTDIHLQTNEGINCLHIAANGGHLGLCKVLIDKHRLDVNMANNFGWTALHCSAKSGSYELVTYFADMGIGINLKTNDGKNCLHIAALAGHLDLCKVLIDKQKFDLHMADNNGWKALHFSTQSGNYELIRYFADMGTDIHLKTNDGINCLHIGARQGHLNLCKELIDEHNFDVNMAGNSGWTAIHLSAKNGSYELLTYFLDMGADIHLKTNDGKNCLHISALQGHLDLCKVLIDEHKFDVNIADNFGSTALHCSAQCGSYEVFSYFAEMVTDIYLKRNDGINCLHIAASQGHSNLCKVLIDKHKFDVNMADNLGWTALHCSAQSGSYELVTYFADMGPDIYLKRNDVIKSLHMGTHNGHLKFCKMLLNKTKFDVNMNGSGGRTISLFFSPDGSYELVTYYVYMGTNIHLKANDGVNCLHIAARSGHLNLCKMLIDKHKFDVSMADNFGCTALHYSVYSGSYEIVTYFADLGPDIHLKTNDGRNCLHIAALEGHLKLCKYFVEIHNFDANIKDNLGWAALHFSAESGSYEAVTYFADMGADIHLKTNDGRNCLHIAALEGHLKLCKYFVESHNFDVNMKDNEGWTSLHTSAKNGSFDVFSYIFGKRSEIYCKTNSMKNVLHLSAENGHVDICEFVLEHFRKDYKENNIRNQHSLISPSYVSEVFYKYNTIFLHAMDNEGNTYLHLAAGGNQAKVCELLLKYDSEIITLLNKKDETARQIAQERNHKEVLMLLKGEYDRTGMFFRVFCYTV